MYVLAYYYHHMQSHFKGRQKKTSLVRELENIPVYTVFVIRENDE